MTPTLGRILALGLALAGLGVSFFVTRSEKKKSVKEATKTEKPPIPKPKPIVDEPPAPKEDAE
jgi:hypothetical protein